MRKVYKGFLGFDDYNVTMCGDSRLIEDINIDFKKGEKVSIQYYLSDKKITEEQAKEALIVKTFGGEIDELDFVLSAYSEYTILEFTEEMKVGGHDLVMELAGAGWKYLILIIETQ